MEGTAELQHHYHLKMGDVLIFAQKEDSTIVLAGRPPTKADAIKKPPVRRPSPTPGGRSGRRDQVCSSMLLSAVWIGGNGSQLLHASGMTTHLLSQQAGAVPSGDHDFTIVF